MNTKTLYQLLGTESESGNTRMMTELVTQLCESLGATVTRDVVGNLYAVKGSAETYPCVVAHLDTVHNITGNGIELFLSGDYIFGMDPETVTQVGVGGDDKCGIYAALYCLEHCDNIKAAFFQDEETGCEGSSACNLKFFKDCRFVLQADRRGTSDFVTDISGPLASKKFISHVSPLLKKYGYKTCSGAMTDVMQLRDDDVGVSVANMSAGYFNPHTHTECVSLAALNNASNLMLEICRTMTEQYKFIAPKREVARATISSTSGRTVWEKCRLTGDWKLVPYNGPSCVTKKEEEQVNEERFPDYEPTRSDMEREDEREYYRMHGFSEYEIDTYLGMR